MMVISPHVASQDESGKDMGETGARQFRLKLRFLATKTSAIHSYRGFKKNFIYPGVPF